LKSAKIPPDLGGRELDIVVGLEVAITAFGGVLTRIFSKICEAACGRFELI